jgi:hypothetical protein
MTMRPALRRIVAGQVLVPDLEIGLGDAGVGGQDEQQRMRIGSRLSVSQFRADRVQPRCRGSRTPLQQRVREIDDRMAPARDVYAAFVAMLQRGQMSSRFRRRDRICASSTGTRFTCDTREKRSLIFPRARSSANVTHCRRSS